MREAIEVEDHVMVKRRVGSLPDANCITTPDGDCIGGPCMHNAPRGARGSFVERGCAADLAEEVGRMVFAFDPKDGRRDEVRKLAARIAAFVYETTTTLEGEQREHRETLALLRDAERRRDAAESMLDEWKVNAPHPSVIEERDVYAARWREVTKACDAAKAKAEQYERDWYAAKSEFGDAMAKMRERNRALRTAIESAHAELCKAYRDWDADRDSKVGKRIGDIARSLKAVLEHDQPATPCGCGAAGIVKPH